LAQPACLALVEKLCHQPPLSCGVTLKAKNQFYLTDYDITLNSNCEAQRVFKKIVKDRFKGKQVI
jgi:hypothetical protein